MLPVRHEMPAASPLIFDPDKCIACNQCVDICQVDVLIPGPTGNTPPVVLFPGECWYCGCCVVVCPVEGAVTFRHPLMNQVRWINKEELTKSDH